MSGLSLKPCPLFMIALSLIGVLLAKLTAWDNRFPNMLPHRTNAS